MTSRPHDRPVGSSHDDDVALLNAGYDTGFYDEAGRPAPWPSDPAEWRQSTYDPPPLNPGEQPF